MDDKRITIERWLVKADRDLQTARTMLRADPAPTDVVCFHSHQCAEKCLKAFLVAVDQDFPKTHDLQRLLQFCASHDEQFAELSECAIALTDYGVETRYVDEWRDIPSEEADEAVARAVQVRGFVLGKLAIEDGD